MTDDISPKLPGSDTVRSMVPRARHRSRRRAAAADRASAAAYRRPAREPRPPRVTDGSARTTSSFLRANVGWILLVTTLVVLGAAAISWSRTPIYQSHADVLVQPRIYTEAAAPQAPDMGTEKAVAASGQVLDIASRALDVPAEALAGGLSVTVPLDTHILEIGYSSADAAEAARRAQGLADAYVSYWIEQQPTATASKTAASAAVAVTKTAVITTAKQSISPSSPNHSVDLGIAVIVGLSLGVGSGLIRDRLDDGLRGPADLEARVNAPVLALVPPIRRRRGDSAGRLIMVGLPQSAAAAAYRDLRTRVLRTAAHRGASTLLVTSPAGPEKTAVAANLAVALAQAGQRVVLVCADLRWPALPAMFGYDNRTGLTDVLEGLSDIDQVLLPTAVDGLTLLPAGPVSGDHAIFLHRPALREVIAVLGQRYDFVVVDSPPVLVGADTGSLAELTEMLIVVADARHCSRNDVLEARRQLDHVTAKLIGGVLGNAGHRQRVSRPSPVARAIARTADDPRAGREPEDPAGWTLPAVGSGKASEA